MTSREIARNRKALNQDHRNLNFLDALSHFICILSTKYLCHRRQKSTLSDRIMNP